MIKEGICPNPACGSTDTGEGELHYSCTDPVMVSASWLCNDCGCSYEVLYKYDITIIHDMNWGEY